jgi:filamentous hemagglutinin family protein
MRSFLSPRIALPLALSSLVLPARAQITLDGTLGAPSTLTGPRFEIPASVGQTRGANLFHSFGTFNLAAGQSANFSGPASVANILARVTGGAPSSINGTLGSSIAGANLFLLNPNGVMFGPNAQLDLSGSFAASTADVARLQGGGVFHASNPSASILTSAPPVAFGFLGPRPAPIVLSGSTLEVGDNRTISLLGGDIRLQSADLEAESGRVNLVSAGTAAEVALNAARVDSAVLLSGPGGVVLLRDSAVSTGTPADAGVGSGAGGVVVRGAQLVLDSSSLRAQGRSSRLGAPIDIEVSGDVTLRRRSTVSTSTPGTGRGGDATVRAASVLIETNSTLSTESTANGRGGDVRVQAGRLRVASGAVVVASTTGSGTGGGVAIRAGQVVLDAAGRPIVTGVIVTPGANGGRSGNILIESGTLHILNGAQVAADSFSTADGGAITIRARDVVLDGGPGRVGSSIDTNTLGRGGRGGDVRIECDTLRLFNAQISSDTLGDRAGSILVEARDILLDGRGGLLTGLFAQSSEPPGSRASSGDIRVRADSIRVQNRAIISTLSDGSGEGGSINIQAGTLQVLAGGLVDARATQRGPGGSIVIQARDVLIDRAGAPIFTGVAAETEARQNGGSAGDIHLQADTLRVLNGGEISATTIGSGAGGDIVLEVQRITLDGGDQPFTGIGAQTLAPRGGRAGSILIRGRAMQVRNGAQIVANTSGQGAGGSLIINVDNIVIDGAGRDNTRSFTGLAAGSLDPGTGGAAGDILINGDALLVRNGGAVSTATAGGGRGGDIVIGVGALKVLDGGLLDATTRAAGPGGSIAVQAASVLLDGSNSSGFTGLSAGSPSANGGPGGSITLEAGRLRLVRGGQISVTTFGTGDGGDISVRAEDIRLEGGLENGGTSFTGISAQSISGSGKAGDIRVDAGGLSLDGGATIAANTNASGEGGSIAVRTQRDVVLSDDSGIVTSALQSRGGTVSVDAGGDILLRDSRVESFARGDGGGITLRSARLVGLRNSSLIARTQGGVGGNILLQGRFVVIDRGEVNANAVGGAGGDITVRAPVFLASSEASITASSEFGVDGAINIESPANNLNGSLLALPVTPLGAEDLLPERCVVLRRGADSSFTIRLQSAPPPTPDGLLPSIGAR